MATAIRMEVVTTWVNWKIRSDLKLGYIIGLDQASVDTTQNSEDEPTDDPLSDSSSTWLVNYNQRAKSIANKTVRSCLNCCRVRDSFLRFHLFLHFRFSFLISSFLLLVVPWAISWLCWVNSLDFGQANEIVPRHPSMRISQWNSLTSCKHVINVRSKINTAESAQPRNPSIATRPFSSCGVWARD